jgi:hypothetical protein
MPLAVRRCAVIRDAVWEPNARSRANPRTVKSSGPELLETHTYLENLMPENTVLDGVLEIKRYCVLERE